MPSAARIGTSLIEEVCKRGDSIGLPVELRVLKVNSRSASTNGLASTQAESETHFLMRRAPGGAA
jgi:hypothetical protein